MPKALTRLPLALAAALLCAQAAVPQTTLEWIVLSPAGEGFTARVPGKPEPAAQRVNANGLDASGRRYAYDDGTAAFVVWSMKGSRAGVPLGGGDRARWTSYGVAPELDAAAELAWELLVAPEFERLERKGVTGSALVALDVGMKYVDSFGLVGGTPAREYSVRLEQRRGLVYVCAEGAQVYVVAALGAGAGDERPRQFLNSFALKSADAPGAREAFGPGRGAGGGTAAGTGRGDAPAGGDIPYKQSEVTKKALITFKPEPGFTQEARKFNVTGVVRLRAVLHSSGEMRNISVVKGLPHGLTEQSVETARRISFQPARKDGRAVSQYVVLEYNYNIY